MIVHPILLQCSVDEVIPIILTSDSASKSYDGESLIADHVTIDGDLDARDSFTFDVSGSQILVGETPNTFEYELANVSGKTYQVQKVEGVLRITDEDVSSDVVVDKGLYPGGPYRLGDEVTFSVHVTNIYDNAQTITLSEVERVTLSDSIFTDVEGGGSRDTTATYTITEADILRGEFTNTVFATVGNHTYTAEASVETEEPNGHLTVTALFDMEDYPDGAPLGAEVPVQLSIINDGNLTITEITLVCELTDVSYSIASLAPGESMPFSGGNYTVSIDDIENGYIYVLATASGVSPDPDHTDVPVDDGEDEEPTAELAPALSVRIVETSTPASPAGTYTAGETVTGTVTVSNDGNIPVSNISITLEMTTDEWSSLTLDPGETYTVPWSYPVEEEDLIRGYILFEAAAVGEIDDPDNPEVYADPDQLEVQTEALNGHLTVYAYWDLSNYPSGEVPLGGEVPFLFDVTNDGNLTITNITVRCELTGDAYTIVALGPGESENYVTSYKVTEADLLVGEVTAVATASGDSPDPDNPDVPVYPGEDVFPTVSRNGHLIITARNTTHSSGPYALDDIIDVAFIVFNDGNLTIRDIWVESERTTGGWGIDSLQPGEFEQFTDSTRVDEPDLVEGEIVIDYYVASNSSPDPDVPEAPSTSDTVVVSTEAAAPHIVIGLSSIPAGPYAPGDTVSVTVTVTNDGNLTSSATAVSSAALGNRTIGYLYPTGYGSTYTYTVLYTFTMADATRGYVDFAATVSGTTIDPNNPTVSATSTTQRITCQYVLSFKANTEATTSGAKDAAIPFNLSGISSANTMTVDWGDGTTSALKASDYGSNYSDGTASIHTYATAGEYTIRVTYDGDWTSTTLGWYATSTDLTTTYNSRNEFIAVFIQTLTEMLTPLPPIGIIRYYSSASPTGNPSTKSNAVSHMFRYCKKLTTIPANLFILNTGVTAAEYTFNNCQSLASIPSGLLDPLTLVTSLASMFTSCKLVTTIPSGLLDKNTVVTSINNLFYGCEALTAIPAHLLDKLVSLSTATNLFYGCKLVTTIPTDFLKFNTALTNVGYMFYNCYAITAIPVDLFRYNTRITNFQYAFRSCNALTTLPTDIFKYNTAATNFKNVFYSCTNLGGFTIHIGASGVSSGNAANFVTKKTGATRTVYVPSGSTTQTTFNSVASSLGLTITGE